MMIRNKKLEEKLRQILEQAVEENLVAGGNLLVWEDGKELVYTQAGLADRENNKKNKQRYNFSPVFHEQACDSRCCHDSHGERNAGSV